MILLYFTKINCQVGFFFGIFSFFGSLHNVKYLQMGTKFELVEKQFIQEKVLSGVNEGKHRDRFEILEKIGGGSFGVTYKVRLLLKIYKNISKVFQLFPRPSWETENFQFFSLFRRRFFFPNFFNFQGRDLITAKSVVLKFEKTDARHPQLKQERNVYMVSTNMEIPIAPKFVRYSESENLRYYEDKIDSPLTGWFNVLVMEQLGRDIMDIYEFQREVIFFYLIIFIIF